MIGPCSVSAKSFQSTCRLPLSNGVRVESGFISPISMETSRGSPSPASKTNAGISTSLPKSIGRTLDQSASPSVSITTRRKRFSLSRYARNSGEWPKEAGRTTSIWVLGPCPLDWQAEITKPNAIIIQLTVFLFMGAGFSNKRPRILGSKPLFRYVLFGFWVGKAFSLTP
ncbi:hypothetical protein EBT16_05740 [bacterium]|nr:hypothetical protein [bacterium]